MMMLLFFIISVMIAHLGRKPVNGGSPPRDSRINAIIGRRVGILFHMSEIEDIVVEVNGISVINIDAVRMM